MPPDPDDNGEGVGRVPGPRGEIYVEYRQVGQAIKVSAVDAATGMEVVIMGPLSAAQTHLQEIAVRKLKAQLKKAETGGGDDVAGDDGKGDDGGGGPKGWIA